MPIVRKVWGIGNSRAISLPKSWLDYIEKQTGKQVLEVAIEVNGDLKITPILKVTS